MILEAIGVFAMAVGVGYVAALGRMSGGGILGALTAAVMAVGEETIRHEERRRVAEARLNAEIARHKEREEAPDVGG